MVIELRSCPVCSSQSFVPKPLPTTWIGDAVFEPVARHLGLTKCERCHLVFVNPRPSDDLLRRFYASSDYDCHDHESDRNDTGSRLDPVLDLLEPFRPKERPARLLDYGCGGGYFVRRARQRGWDAVGYDIGERAEAVCRSLGLPFVNDLTAARGPFDLISLHHVFEHLPDHPDFFRRLEPLVEKQTLLYIEVPNARSLRARLAAPPLSRHLPVDERYRAFPIHLAYFSLANLSALLESHGYDVVARYNFGAGLDEFFTTLPFKSRCRARPNDGGVEPTPSNHGQRRKSNATRFETRIARTVKDRIKRALWASELGENIAVVARKRRAVAST